MELLKIKKMLSKYSYYRDEFNETEFLFKEYSNSFNKEFNILPDFVPVADSDSVPDFVPVADSDSVPDSVPVAELKEEIEKKSNLKLYRKLSLLTHPDKKGGSAEIFNQVHLEYTKGNTLGLLLLAQEYHLEINYLEYSESDFESSLTVLAESSAKIKSSLAWVWQSADSVKRQELRERFKF